MRFYPVYVSFVVIFLNLVVCSNIQSDGSCDQNGNEECVFPQKNNPKKSATIEFSDGSSYTGELKGGKYHGYGKLILSNGDVFEGIPKIG